jgi:hypothetical protein
MSRIALIYNVNPDGGTGALLEAVPLGGEYIVIGIQDDMTHTINTTVKWTSLPFFLLRALASVISPEKETSCSG